MYPLSTSDPRDWLLLGRNHVKDIHGKAQPFTRCYSLKVTEELSYLKWISINRKFLEKSRTFSTLGTKMWRYMQDKPTRMKNSLKSVQNTFKKITSMHDEDIVQDLDTIRVRVPCACTEWRFIREEWMQKFIAKLYPPETSKDISEILGI